MMQVSARKMPARVAVAGGIDRSRVAAMTCIADAYIAVAREKPAVSGVPRRQHAVEHVDAGQDARDDVLRGADAHQVTRLVVRKTRRRMVEHAHHLVLGLANGQTADRVAVEADAGEALA